MNIFRVVVAIYLHGAGSLFFTKLFDLAPPPQEDSWLTSIAKLLHVSYQAVPHPWHTAASTPEPVRSKSEGSKKTKDIATRVLNSMRFDRVFYNVPEFTTL
jgi:hypothetical protein